MNEKDIIAKKNENRFKILTNEEMKTYLKMLKVLYKLKKSSKIEAKRISSRHSGPLEKTR